MIIPEKVRNMSKNDQLKWYIKKFADSSQSESNRREALEYISKAFQNHDIYSICKDYELDGSVILKEVDNTGNDRMDSPILRIRIPDSEDTMDFEIVDINKKNFIDPNPVKAAPIKSFLTEEEKAELLNDPNAGPRVIK